MAGSGNELTTWASSAAYHQDKGDYNDNVIVPRSILVDTADAIRTKKSGTAEVKSDVDVSGETFLASSSIAPIDFATEIGNLTTGGSSITPITFKTLTFSSSSSSSTISLADSSTFIPSKIKALCIGCFNGSSQQTRSAEVYIYTNDLLETTSNIFTYSGVDYIKLPYFGIGNSFNAQAQPQGIFQCYAQTDPSYACIIFRAEDMSSNTATNSLTLYWFNNGAITQTIYRTLKSGFIQYDAS